MSERNEPTPEPDLMLYKQPLDPDRKRNRSPVSNVSEDDGDEKGKQREPRSKKDLRKPPPAAQIGTATTGENPPATNGGEGSSNVGQGSNNGGEGSSNGGGNSNAGGSSSNGGGNPNAGGNDGENPSNAGGNPTRARQIKVEDENELPELLNEGHGGISPFPGAQCVTVAKVEIENRNTMYLNRYGPQRYPWFVLSEECHLEHGMTEEQLIDISNRNRRVLDHPIDKEDPDRKQKKFGASKIDGLLGVVWNFDGRLSPRDAVEALNPEKVKQADIYATIKDRRDYTRKTNTRLQTYPITYTWVLFLKPINTLVDPHGKKLKEPTYHNWELSSKYRSCYPKSTINKEWEIYGSAKRQADRFLKWYKDNTSPQQREGSVINTIRHKTEDRRLPTVDPLPKGGTRSRGSSYASEAEFVTDADEEDEVYPSIEMETPAPRDTPRPKKVTVEDTRRTNSPAPRRTPRSKKATVAKPPDGDEEEPTEEALKEAALMGFMAGNNIEGELSRAQQMKFDMYWQFRGLKM